MKTFSLKNVSFGFYKQELFFSDLSLTLEAGKFYLLTGANGVGKSTLFRLLKGAIEPHEYVKGSVMLDDKSIPLQNTHERKQLANFCLSVPQSFDEMLVGALTVEENFKMAHLRHYPSLTFPSLDPGLAAQADKYKLSLTKKVSDLSGGQRQLVSICMMLQKKAPILLFDEPTAALDSKQSIAIAEILRTEAANRGIIIMAICHDQRVIEKQMAEFVLELVIESNLRKIKG